MGQIIYPFQISSSGMDLQFHPTLIWSCDYLSMLRLKVKPCMQKTILGAISTFRKTAYRKISQNLEDARSVVKFTNRSKIWRAFRQHCHRTACQITKWHEHLTPDLLCSNFARFCDKTYHQMLKWPLGTRAFLKPIFHANHLFLLPRQGHSIHRCFLYLPCTILP